MNSIIIIFLLIINIINCYDDIRYINKTNRRVEMSFEAVGNGTDYWFLLKLGNKSKQAIVRAIFIEQINSTGWGHLSITSSEKFSDELQAYYSGVIEAILTRQLIRAHISNVYPNYCSNLTEFCQNLQQYLSTNIDAIIKKSRNQGGYWKMIRLQLWQIKGLQDGYDYNWKSLSKEINENYLIGLKNQIFGLFLLQAFGDLSALSKILGGEDYHSTFPGRKIIGDGSCSAFIKYVKGDVYAAHVTWTSYNMMLRITKFYNFPYRFDYVETNSSIIPGQNISFSSYPGLISSIDDFYITSAGLVTTETTIGNYNKSLWIPLKDRAASIVLEYFRVQTANRLSQSGSQWTSLFSLYNSGTYNNQWMVVNYNIMKGHQYGMAIPDGVLYVAEQIPGMIVAKDQTDFIRKSYWASYNIPFYEVIYKTSGYADMAKLYGNFFTIDKGPRALIFKRDSKKVTNLKALMKLMRYNDFRNDPLARCNCTPPYSGENGISARADLSDPNGKYPFGALAYGLHGGTDLKYTNVVLSNAMRFVGISSPTYDQQPVFDWRKITDPNANHNMHPNIWNFKPIITPFPED